MAQLLETLRNNAVRHIDGRNLGIDKDETLVGVKSLKHAVQDLTSASTATSLNNYGTIKVTGSSLMTSAAGGAFLLPLPIPGVDLTIVNENADTSAASPGSTAMTFIRPSTSFVIKSSEGTTNTTINLAAGACVTLHGASTGVYVVKTRTTLAGVIINGTT